MTAEAKRARLTLIGAGSLILLAILISIHNLAPAKKYSQTTLYFSDDDGKSWYLDSNINIPPYDHDGHDAVGAALYRTARNSAPFCGYLYRFPDGTKKQLDALQPNARVSAAYSSITAADMEVKSPGSSGNWYTVGTPGANKVMTIQSPDGSELDRVLP